MGTRCAEHVTPLYPQKFALTSPTGGGCSVGIVRVRTKVTELILVLPKNHLTRILETAAVHISLLWCSFTCRQSLPTFFSHQILIGIAVRCPAKSYIEYTLMTSAISQYLIIFWSFVPPLSNLIIRIFAKTNPSLATSLTTVTLNGPEMQKVHAFRLPILFRLFHCSFHTKKSKSVSL